MDESKVYLETSIVSYLTARLSRDLVAVSRQELTRQWWDQHRGGYRLFISEFVVAEAAAGADYLLTWNFRHLANASLRKRIDVICLDQGFEAPVICTPEELMGL